MKVSTLTAVQLILFAMTRKATEFHLKRSAVPQDIGFGGIANIDSTYTATHVDTRTTNFWKGDEVKTTAYSVTDDFYKYYGLGKSDVYPATVNKKSKNITLTIDGTTYSGILEEK